MNLFSIIEIYQKKMTLSLNVKNFFSSHTIASSTNSINQLVSNADSVIKLKTTSINKMDDSDLDTDQILSGKNANKSNYASTENILQEATSSTAQLTESSNSLKASSFFESRAKIITVVILFLLNLINYVDRFTIAGIH